MIPDDLLEMIILKSNVETVAKLSHVSLKLNDLVHDPKLGVKRIQEDWADAPFGFQNRAFYKWSRHFLLKPCNVDLVHIVRKTSRLGLLQCHEPYASENWKLIHFCRVVDLEMSVNSIIRHRRLYPNNIFRIIFLHVHQVKFTLDYIAALKLVSEMVPVMQLAKEHGIFLRLYANSLMPFRYFDYCRKNCLFMIN